MALRGLLVIAVIGATSLKDCALRPEVDDCHLQAVGSYNVIIPHGRWAPRAPFRAWPGRQHKLQALSFRPVYTPTRSLPALQAARPGGASSVSTPLPIKNHNNLAEAVKVSDPNLTFAQLYELKEKLGKGQYAVVHRALHRTSKLECAVKCIRKATLTAEDLAALEIEVAAQRRLGDHPNFVRMYQYFEEKDFFFIVLELISGGELFERIVEKVRRRGGGRRADGRRG